MNESSKPILEYNDGTIMPMDEIEDKQKAAHEFAEGNIDLEKLLLLCWENGINTISSCAGEDLDDKYSMPMIVFRNDESLRPYLPALIHVLENEGYTMSIESTRLSGNDITLIDKRKKTNTTKLFSHLIDVIKNCKDKPLTEEQELISEIMKIQSENMGMFARFQITIEKISETEYRFSYLNKFMPYEFHDFEYNMETNSFEIVSDSREKSVRSIQHILDAMNQEIEVNTTSKEEARERCQNNIARHYENQRKIRAERRSEQEDKEFSQIEFQEYVDDYKRLSVIKSFGTLEKVARQLEILAHRGMPAKANFNGIDVYNYSSVTSNPIHPVIYQFIDQEAMIDQYDKVLDETEEFSKIKFKPVTPDQKDVAFIESFGTLEEVARELEILAHRGMPAKANFNGVDVCNYRTINIDSNNSVVYQFFDSQTMKDQYDKVLDEENALGAENLSSKGNGVVIVKARRMPSSDYERKKVAEIIEEFWKKFIEKMKPQKRI